jgi:hypothetical protein
MSSPAGPPLSRARQTISVAVVAAIAALGLGLVWLLPRSALADPH